MRTTHRDPRPTRRRARTPPTGWVAAVACALASLLLASCATGGNACDHPPVGVGAVVTGVQAAGDPCAGRPLRSAPGQWPPVVQLDYRIGGKAGRLTNLAEPPPEHMKAAG